MDADSRKEIRDAEDAACNAGMRNPAAVCNRWPELVEAMQPVRQALLSAIAKCPDLQDLPLAVGKSPIRQPPAEASIALARDMVAEALAVKAKSANSWHTAGKWRYNLVADVQKRCMTLMWSYLAG